MANSLPVTAARIQARVSLEAKALIQKAVDIESGTRISGEAIRNHTTPNSQSCVTN